MVIGDRGLRFLCFVFLIGLLILAAASSAVGKSSVSFSMMQTDSHHVAGLNSNQPYIAGCCVASEGLMKYEIVDAVAVEVSFPSTDPSNFSAGSWLGAGVFVQAQDTRFLHVDYGFYVMLVLEASGKLFVDIGLHQTREGDMPLLMPSEELIFARTWQLSGLDPAASVTLTMEWGENKRVNYALESDGERMEFASVRVPSFPNCENMIPGFYSGNVIVGQFPMSRYVNYFQFGITSPSGITSDRWNVLLQEPRILRHDNWSIVDRAWSVQGDRSYIDQDWRWGGRPYTGVDAQYQMNSPQGLNQVLFFHGDRTLSTGTLLWEPVNTRTNGLTDSTPYNVQNDRTLAMDYSLPSYVISGLVVISAGETYWALRRKRGLERLSNKKT